jgi:hypothetical protein
MTYDFDTTTYLLNLAWRFVAFLVFWHLTRQWWERRKQRRTEER